MGKGVRIQKTGWQVSRKRTIKEKTRRKTKVAYPRFEISHLPSNLLQYFFRFFSVHVEKTILLIFFIKLKYFFKIRKNFCNVKQTPATETVNYNQAASSKAET